MSRLDDLLARLAAASGDEARSLSIARMIARERDELQESAAVETTAAMLNAELTYYARQDGIASADALVRAVGEVEAADEPAP